ncbi:alpha-xylosidase [Chryseobacterium phosphatilyticum]|uniref:Alpha-xylosidase n=1 Tax=Chryseobacterium phosphatilyticum TaxID=475075 RepID=A0A316X8D1_9FLAO|nr:glycoside hydrolase family 31 protein [Chryseobacterium phosphatilyticum]PWN68986.1 alpha-xylosidase [Chryseobacterium phosphatilyticum]
MKKMLTFFWGISFLFFSFAQTKSNPLILGNARFSIISPELIRMEYAFNGKFVDDPSLFAVNRNEFSPDFEIEKEKDNIYLIKTKRMKIRYRADGKPFSQMNISATIYNTPNDYQWKIYSTDDANLGGALSTLDGIEKEVPTNPGLLSKNGWQLIDDSGKEIIKDGWIHERPIEHYRDLYLFAYGKDYKSALQALTKISGEIPMNRKYVHGIWYCRWWDYTSQDLLDIVSDYQKNDFPLDVLAIDMGWHTQKEAKTGMGHAGMYGWTGYTWNNELIPDPKKLLNSLKNDQIKVVLNDHPHDGIRKHEKYYSQFMKAMEADTIGKKELMFDSGNKKYMENFFRYALEPHENNGVNFWWLDWQQDYIMPNVPGYKNLKHLPWLNHLYFEHSKKNNPRGLLFSRWAGWGSQRTPIQFSGDAGATWEMLKFEIPFTVSSSNAGCFFWAHDVGGFYGGKDPELYVRWTQFAMTTAALRIHSEYHKDLDRRPWLWGSQAEKAMRIAYHLRSRLMPYIYSSVYQAHFQSLPLVRGLYIDYPEEENAYSQKQQYMFGDLLLSAPIVTPGKGKNWVASQSIWFPPGDLWYDITTHEKYNGGDQKLIEKDIYSFPLYVKGGVPLPLQQYSQRTTASTSGVLTLRCYPGLVGKTGTYELYEDDGVSNDYKKGNYLLTKLSYTQQSDRKALIKIKKKDGNGYKGMEINRTYRIELPLNANKVYINGKKTKIIKDEIPYVEILKQDINKNIEVRIDS